MQIIFCSVTLIPTAVDHFWLTILNKMSELKVNVLQYPSSKMAIGHGNILIAAIARAKQRAALYVLLPGVYCIFRWCTENVNLIGGILTKLQLIRWKKSFCQIHSLPEEELQPEPALLVLSLPWRIQGALENGGIAIKY